MGYNDAYYSTLYGSGQTTIHIRPSGIDELGHYDLLSAGRVIEVTKHRHVTTLYLDHHSSIPDADCAILVAVDTPDGREHLIVWRDRVYELLDGINRMVPPDDADYS